MTAPAALAAPVSLSSLTIFRKESCAACYCFRLFFATPSSLAALVRVGHIEFLIFELFFIIDTFFFFT